MGVSIKDKPDDKLFIAQKHCIRILFGDLDVYLEKQSTCAYARPLYQQILGAQCHEKEHTKPLFSRLNILTTQGLFKYYCISEISSGSSNLAAHNRCMRFLIYLSATQVIGLSYPPNQTHSYTGHLNYGTQFTTQICPQTKVSAPLQL